MDAVGVFGGGAGVDTWEGGPDQVGDLLGDAGVGEVVALLFSGRGGGVRDVCVSL